jgi:alkyldihydroxyacetonephosphate synthase
MKVSNEQVISSLGKIVGNDKVITELSVLQENSHDRHLKFQAIHGVFPCPLPICVCHASSTQQVSEILKFCNANGVRVVPKTGGSATEGGLQTTENCIVLDASDMNGIVEFNEEDMYITCKGGTPLIYVEKWLQARGYTTGHSPQSQEFAQMGGLVATRSIGQFSNLYGGIEDMVLALEVVLADGTICKTRIVPRKASGPDLRHMIMGGEGALGVITEVTVKVFKYSPSTMWKAAYLMEDFHAGIDLIRDIMVEGYKPSTARLYDVGDTELNFGDVLDCKGKCIILFIAEGHEAITAATGKAIAEFASKRSAEPVDTKVVDIWLGRRNYTDQTIADEKVEILETKKVYFSTEICATWSNIHKIYDAVMANVPQTIPNLVVFGGHASHSYLNGTCVYFIYQYNALVDDPIEERKIHEDIVNGIAKQVLRFNGTVTHHHGMGKLKAHLYREELGSSYVLMERLKDALDPNGIMNPGCILPENWKELK